MIISAEWVLPVAITVSVKTFMDNGTRYWQWPFAGRSWQKVQRVDLPPMSEAGLHRAGTEREGFTLSTRSTGCGFLGRPAGRQPRISA